MKVECVWICEVYNLVLVYVNIYVYIGKVVYKIENIIDSDLWYW